MKKMLFSILLAILVSLTANNTVAQQTTPEVTKRLYYTAKVWGFLKNYHPEVNGCNRNLDSILLALIPRILASTNDAEFTPILGDLLAYAGTQPPPIGDPIELEPREKRNIDLRWTHDPLLGPSASNQLDSIYQNFRADSNCYFGWNWDPSGYYYKVDEIQYTSSVALKTENKLLLFFRYWNIINYFYPYKYATDVPWDSTLMDFIPQCLDITDQLSQHLFFGRLQTRMNDAHAFTSSSIFSAYFGSRYFPFAILFTEGKTVITRVFDNSTGVKVGDVITAIDGIDIGKFRDSLRVYATGSNPPTVERNLNNYVIRSKTDNASLTLDDGSGPRTINVDRSFDGARYYDSLYANPNPIWYIMPGNVGYIDMGRLTTDMVDAMYEDLKKTKALVFDVRNYPNGTMYDICDRIMPDAVEFVRFAQPVPSYPGYLYYQEPGIFCGPQAFNSDWFQGQVFILMNEETQSHAEFTIMSLQTHPNAVIVGSQTAGADGNVMEVPLISGLNLFYTGLGVYYPDWSETQRIGIKPDINVRPTVDGIRKGKDEVLAAALNLLDVPGETVAGNGSLEVYPNPFSDKIRVRLSNSITEAVTIRVYDVLGRRVSTQAVTPSTASNEIEISVDPKLSNGLYLLEITGDKTSTSVTVIKE